MIIGSHVSYSKNGLLGSTQEALSYGANTFMFYTGAPQNTIRKEIDEQNTIKALELMNESNIDIKKVICHAPYIINLANSEKMNFGISFLKQEIQRCEKLNIKYIVLHPGSAVGQERQVALKNIANAINIVLENKPNIVILLETMAGKGSECGSTIEEIKFLINNIIYQDKIGVCLDTCHLNDSGIDISKFDEYLIEFDEKIGINKIGCVHVNDSMNPLSSHKDRHANLGYGTIGFNNLLKVVYHDKLKDVPKILETPFIENYAPYKFEIESIKTKQFNNNLQNSVISYYKNL